MINAKINRISNFLYGNSVQESIFNAFCYGLDHRIIQGGVEHKFGAVNKYLRNTAASTSDKETFLNIEKIRKIKHLGFPRPSKILPKAFQNQCPKNMRFFIDFWLKNALLRKR